MKKSPLENQDDVQFLEFWRSVAGELGNSRLRINRQASSIHDFLDRDCDGRHYLKRIVRKSYKLSRCQHLESAISLEQVLDLLGETAYELQGEQRDDLFDIELLEEIAWHISSRYSSQLEAILETKIALATNSASPDQTGGSAQVVSFPIYKIRRANSLL